MQAAERTHQRLVWAVAAAAVVVVALVVGLVTYNAEWWGGKTLPQAQAATAETASDDVVSADTVAAQLRGKGLKVKKTKEFSGAKKGAFLGYRGNDAGARVKSGSTVEVRESAGAGVPGDTVGKEATAVTKTFGDMGVPVHYKHVLISDASQTKEGTVVNTSPEPGQAVSDAQEGIYIGVAAKGGDGIPVDIMGRDVDDVASELESKGYDVTVKKRLASKQYIGKVSGSQPAPGSTLGTGESVTVYQGVDAKGAKDTFLQSADATGSKDSMILAGQSADDVAAGRWCNKSGDCITLGGINGGRTDGQQVFGVVDGAQPDKYAMSDSMLVSCDAIQQAFCSTLSKDYLLQGDTGAFELIPHKAFMSFWCGDTRVSRNGAGFTQYCNAGKVVDVSGQSSPTSVKDTGGKYRMSNFFVVAPVGTKLDKLESSGYFDRSALDAAHKQHNVDTDRPFLLYRDVKQYDDNAREADYNIRTANPFLPFNAAAVNELGKDRTVKMRPAPSDDTVYYLDETPELDWDTLEDADVDGAAADASDDKTQKKSDIDSDNDEDADTDRDDTDNDNTDTDAHKKDLTPEQIRTRVYSGDMSPIAGRYCLKDGSDCLELDDDGKVTTAESSSTHETMIPVAKGAKLSWDIPESVGIEFRGPESDYHCGSERGYQACYEGSTFYSEAEITKPFNFVYIFKGADSEEVKSIALSAPQSDYVPPDSTKPFIKTLGYHMNASPSDTNVYYPAD